MKLRGVPIRQARVDSKDSVQKAILAIQQGDDFEREKAIEYLKNRSTQRVVRHVLPLLRQRNTPTRMAAVEVLKQIGPADITGVEGLLADENEDIRVYGCEIMGGMRRPETIPCLVRVIESDTENVKSAAVMALGEFKDERAVSALLKALKEDEWIVFSAIYSLGKIKHRAAVEPLLRVMEDSREEVSLAACEVLLGFGDDEVLDRMFTILKGWTPKRRDRYVEVIVQRGNEKLFLRLKKKIGHDLFEHLVTYMALEKANVIPMLKLLVHFKTEQTCRIVLSHLAKIDPEEPEYDHVLELFVSVSSVWAKGIEQFLDQGDEAVLAIVKACARINLKVSEEILENIFANSSVKVRREIIKNAPSIVAGEGIGLIRKALRDQDGHVQSYGAQAVGAMGLKNVVTDIADLSRKGFMDVRVSALTSLIALDPKKALHLAEEFAIRGTKEDRKVYLAIAKDLPKDENLPLVRTLLASGDEEIRRGTVSVVGHFIDDSRYAEIFAELLHGDSIPHEILKIVREKKLSTFRPQLKIIFSETSRSLWTRYYALMALGAFKDPSLFGLFVNGLDDENDLIKIGSLKALGDLGDPRAATYVEPLLENQDENVRSAAKFVVARLEGTK